MALVEVGFSRNTRQSCQVLVQGETTSYCLHVGSSSLTKYGLFGSLLFCVKDYPSRHELGSDFALGIVDIRRARAPIVCVGGRCFRLEDHSCFNNKSGQC